MKKYLLLLVAALIGTSVMADNVVLNFSSKGPDKYADGTVILDGEYYALVWIKDGVEFQGFNADGTLAGLDETQAQVLTYRPKALNGQLRPNNYQIEVSAAAKLNGGVIKLFVLDTRLVDKTTLSGSSGTTPASVNGYGEATSAAFSINGVSTPAKVVTFATTVTQIPTQVKNPVIKSITVKDGFAYLTVSGTVACLQYNVATGEKPGALTNVKAATEAKNGDETKDILFIVPIEGNATQFFKINRNGLDVKAE